MSLAKDPLFGSAEGTGENVGFVRVTANPPRRLTDLRQALLAVRAEVLVGKNRNSGVPFENAGTLADHGSEAFVERARGVERIDCLEPDTEMCESRALTVALDNGANSISNVTGKIDQLFAQSSRIENRGKAHPSPTFFPRAKIWAAAMRPSRSSVRNTP